MIFLSGGVLLSVQGGGSRLLHSGFSVVWTTLNGRFSGGARRFKVDMWWLCYRESDEVLVVWRDRKMRKREVIVFVLLFGLQEIINSPWKSERGD